MPVSWLAKQGRTSKGDFRCNIGLNYDGKKLFRPNYVISEREREKIQKERRIKYGQLQNLIITAFTYGG